MSLSESPTPAAPRIPLLVLGGFLGAGKTTLLNHLLSASDANGQGLRWLAMVNDFGEINIDAQLIAQRHADTLALTNGCVCCSIGGDLSQALIEALARRPLPEAIVIEASGVSDPWRVAQIGMAAPEIALDGVVVVIDASHALRHAADPLLSDTLTRPLAHADLIVLNKTDLCDADTLHAVNAWLDQHASSARRWPTTQAQVPLALLSSAALQTPSPQGVLDDLTGDCKVCGPDDDISPPDIEGHAHPHAHRRAHLNGHRHVHAHDQQFTTWQLALPQPVNEAQLSEAIRALPRSVLRIKGVLLTERGWRELQFAGHRVRWRRAATPASGAQGFGQLVAIGLPSGAEGHPLLSLVVPSGT